MISFQSISIESLLDFKLIKQGFFAVSIIVLILIPIDLFNYFHKEKLKAELKMVSSAVDSFLPAVSEPLSSYESAFQKSSLFGFAPSEGGVSVLKSSIAAMVKDYRLKGVVILDDPEAIIEDARTKKSIFTKQGDKLGDLLVKKIKEESVTFSYYGEEKEIRIE